jgi:hypothetical protein
VRPASATIERQLRSNGRRWLPEKASVQLACSVGLFRREKAGQRIKMRAGACWANSPPIKSCLKPEQQELIFLSTLLGRNAELRHPKRHLHVTTESVA